MLLIDLAAFFVAIAAIVAYVFYLVIFKEKDEGRFGVAPDIKPGRYQHYKGDLYDVYFVGKHTEKNAYYVCYTSVKDSKAYIRPVEMWLQYAEYKGKLVPRYKPYFEGID